MATPWKSEEARNEYYDKLKVEDLISPSEKSIGRMISENPDKTIAKEITEAVNRHFLLYKVDEQKVLKFARMLIYEEVVGGNDEEAKHGHWIPLDECSNVGVYCSLCHKKVYKLEYANQALKSNYCPNCGADMRGGANGSK